MELFSKFFSAIPKIINTKDNGYKSFNIGIEYSIMLVNPIFEIAKENINEKLRI